jgi:hypothetical protein
MGHDSSILGDSAKFMVVSGGRQAERKGREEIYGEITDFHNLSYVLSRKELRGL